MDATMKPLGQVLLHIYHFPFELAIFLPHLDQYKADTPCLIGWDEDELSPFRQACSRHGLVKWINVALVSDTCDDVADKDIPHLIAAFNEDCREGGWLRKMMNYCPSQE
jgi:hypothetical protein